MKNLRMRMAFAVSPETRKGLEAALALNLQASTLAAFWEEYARILTQALIDRGATDEEGKAWLAQASAATQMVCETQMIIATNGAAAKYD